MKSARIYTQQIKINLILKFSMFFLRNANTSEP